MSEQINNAATPVLQLRQINKNFPGVKALQQAQLSLYAGEVHALLGENGAGKSTLVKVMTGVLQKDGGEILLDAIAAKFCYTQRCATSRYQHCLSGSEFTAEFIGRA